MTAYDWTMVFAGVVLIGFVIWAFWKADKTEAIKQPDRDPPGSGVNDV
jgi:hypothetical protein